MNWTAVNFDWNQVRAFLATVEEGSFSAAARALRLTQPTLGRQVAALEDSLGVVLFERAGRSLLITDAGRELLEHVRAMGEAATRVSLAASAQSQTVEGYVCISASDAMAANVLPEILAQLRQDAPGIEIEILASNDLSDLQRREADIALRHVRPDQPELVARLVCELSAGLYAASAYLDREGRPEHVADLAGHAFIGFARDERMIQYLQAMGLPVGPANFHLHCQSGLVVWELTKAGLGITPMFDVLAKGAAGVEQVLPDLPPIQIPVWLTTHRELRTSQKIRCVFDALAEGLAKI